MAELIDDFGRHLNYVRISVTDRCNFRCTYCMPAGGVECLDHSQILRYEEILQLCRVFHELGVRKFRFTGGEPLVRKGLVPFLKELKVQLPDVKTALTTNASLLSQYAEELAAAGLHSLNVSLDTLDPEKFRQITRIGYIETVLAGIRAAQKAGLKNIKLNTVLMKGFNDDEVPSLLKFARAEGLRLRLIEFMPLEDGVWSKDAFISGEEVLRTLPDGGCWRPLAAEADKDGLGPAQYYLNENSGDVIGVITAVSNHFCSSCNRLRVSARGDLRTCLFSPSEIPLRSFIPQPEELRKAILEAIKSKPKCWNDIRNGRLHMSGIGG